MFVVYRNFVIVGGKIENRVNRIESINQLTINHQSINQSNESIIINRINLSYMIQETQLRIRGGFVQCLREDCKDIAMAKGVFYH